MGTRMAERREYAPMIPEAPIDLGAARQAHRILQAGFVVLPILAGLDKFVHALADWDRYLAPFVASQLPVSPHTFMQAVGVIEIVAGLLVALWPAVGGYVVAAWLWGIIVNLVMAGAYYDLALRDLGLSLGALALARLSALFPRRAAVSGRRRA